jgi:hypothetical protein
MVKIICYIFNRFLLYQSKHKKIPYVPAEDSVTVGKRIDTAARQTLLTVDKSYSQLKRERSKNRPALNAMQLNAMMQVAHVQILLCKSFPFAIKNNNACR